MSYRQDAEQAGRRSWLWHTCGKLVDNNSSSAMEYCSAVAYFGTPAITTSGSQLSCHLSPDTGAASLPSCNTRVNLAKK